MTPGRYNRVLASGVLILAASTTRMRAGVVYAEEEFGGCSTEYSLCLEENVCNGCTKGYDIEEYQECYISAVDRSTSSSSSVSCRDIMVPIPCCQDKASEYACMENDAFVEYWECVMVETLDCSTSDLSCSDLGISVNASNSRAVGIGEASRIAVACAIGLLLPLLV